jgi:hypothetical protein
MLSTPIATPASGFSLSDPTIVTGTYHVRVLTYTGATSGQYSDPVTVSATFIDTTIGTGISSAKILFKIGSQSAYATTDSSGLACTTITLNQPAGTSYTVITTLISPNAVPLLQIQQSFEIRKEIVSIDYTGSSGIQAPYSTFKPTLSATITQQADGHPGDITLCRVQFALFKSGNLGSTPDIICYSYCDASGNAQVSSPPDLAADIWTIRVMVDPSNGYYLQDEVIFRVLTITTSTAGSTTGGGWIADPCSSNGKGNFGFIVQYTKNIGIKGNFVYVFRGLDGYDYVVKSNSWQGGGLSFPSSTSAIFSGKCVIQKIDSTTGNVVDSAGNSRFSVYVKDGGTPSNAGDQIAISFSGTFSISHDTLMRSIGTQESPLVPGGGNIVVRKT